MKYPAFLSEKYYPDITEPLKKGTGRILYLEEDGILLELGSLLIAKLFDRTGIGSYLKNVNIKKYELFEVHDGWFSNYLETEYRIKVLQHCYQACYFKDVHNPVNIPPFLRIEKISMKDIGFILDNYHLGDKQYVQERINAGVFIKLTENGTTIGFIGEHSEGTLGFLTVIEKYRNKGYGSLLLNAKIQEKQKNGELAYSHIITSNEKSVNLHKKLGFTILDETITWLSS